MKAKIQPLALARTIRTRTLVVVATMGAILGGLIVFASVQVSTGSPAPRTLMNVTALPTVRVTSSVAELPLPEMADQPAEQAATEDQFVAAWQVAGDPPLPDHDPYVEMEQPEQAADATPRFDGRPLRKVKTIRMLVTAYSPDERSCGLSADGITASGYSVYTNGMKMVAADTRLLPFGSVISIPGYHGGKPVPVLDRGGKIKGKRLDVLYPTHHRATQWGAQWLEVTVWDYAD